MQYIEQRTVYCNQEVNYGYLLHEHSCISSMGNIFNCIIPDHVYCPPHLLSNRYHGYIPHDEVAEV